MTSDSKIIELVEQNQNLSELEMSSEKNSLKVQDSPQPQSKLPTLLPVNQQYYQLNIPAHIMRQLLFQYGQGLPQSIMSNSQFSSTMALDLEEKTATQLMPKHQEYEQQILKHKFIVTLNWVMIAVTTIGGIAASISLVKLGSLFTCNDNLMENAFCIKVMGMRINDQLLKQLLIILIFFGIKTVHYRTIVAFRNRNAEQMTLVFICFTILLGLSLLMVNLFGSVIYGYFAYSTHKLKAIFSKVNEFEKQMTRQGIMNFPLSQYGENQIQVESL
mgnify:FL=1